MKLKEYLEWKQIAKGVAAREIKISRQYLYEILRGRMVPGRDVAQAIVKWTDGYVTFEELWK